MHQLQMKKCLRFEINESPLACNEKCLFQTSSKVGRSVWLFSLRSAPPLHSTVSQSVTTTFTIISNSGTSVTGQLLSE